MILAKTVRGLRTIIFIVDVKALMVFSLVNSIMGIQRAFCQNSDTKHRNLTQGQPIYSGTMYKGAWTRGQVGA